MSEDQNSAGCISFCMHEMGATVWYTNYDDEIDYDNIVNLMVTTVVSNSRNMAFFFKNASVMLCSFYNNLGVCTEQYRIDCIYN